MIDLSQWRASIGGWNSHCTSYCCPSSSPNKISAVGDCLGALAILCGCQVMMSLLSVVMGLRLILMLSGDIELNPGPGQRPELGDAFHLLKSHSTDWQDIGRALGVNKKHRDELFGQGVMKSNDSKLEDVLARWIESQCSEVSWDHLIEVLQDKLEMADTVRKIKQYLLDNDKAKEKYQWKDETSVSNNDDQPCALADPSVPSCLSHYSYMIKDKYKHQPVIIVEWPPRVGKDYYGRLLLLDKKKRDTETEQHKIWNTMRGNIDILPQLTQSRLMDIPDVLKPDSSAIVLIDGPPGVGKTTFCRKLLNMWANGQLPTDQQNRYTVVLYCSLRDKRITGANTLTDILKECYTNRDIEMVSKYFDEHDGDGLLIIFDGWDELSMEHRESSLAVRFICRKILLKCTVIVTSRSYASESIMRLNGNYKHFEVIGFGKAEVHKVIAETLHDDGQLASDLVKELKSQTNIESLCYIPFVCSMVIQVYKKSKHLPSRLTELYEKFVLFAVKKHVKNSLTISTDPKRIQSLKQLPPCIAPSFNKLCHFAYLSLKENNPRMTFTFPELQDALDVSVAEGYIGLMTTVSVYDEELYQFPHLTIQEFLAAWWIANNDGMDVFEEHFEDDHFRMCLRFVAGLTGLKNEKFKEMKYFNIQLDLRCGRDDRQIEYSIDIRSCDHMISTDFPQRLLRLLYESNNTDLCNHMASSCIDSSFCLKRFSHGQSLDSFDAICMLFFLRLSGIKWNKIHLWISSSPLPGLIMSDNSTDVTECKELIIECEDIVRPFKYSSVEPGFLNNVLRRFSSENIHCKCKKCQCFIETLITLLEKPQIKYVSIRGNRQLKNNVSSSSETALSVIRERLETTMTLEKLTVDNMYTNVGANGIVILATVIDGVMRNKSIKSLKIIDRFRYDEYTFTHSVLAVLKNFKQLLKVNTTLEETEFDLSTINPIRYPYDISEINAPLQSVKCSWLKPTEMESVLARCQHLQSLIIDVNFHQPVRIPITNLLNHLPKLCKLTVHSLNSELWVELFTILQTNQTLEELRICDKTLTKNNEILLSLRSCLILNKSITHLDIPNCDETSISTNYLLALTEGLSSNKTIKRLSLPIDITTDEGRSLLKIVLKMESLAVSLKSTLEGECIDGVDLYPIITSLLQQSNSMKEIIINAKSLIITMRHSKCEHHFEELVKTVYNHPTLEYVYLDLRLEEVSSSSLRRILEQYLHKEQILSFINRVPPMIDVNIGAVFSTMLVRHLHQSQSEFIPIMNPYTVYSRTLLS